MPLQFPVARGTIVLCDYAGFRPPERVKRRPVIVLSPRLAHREHLATVVPLSTAMPPADLPYVCSLRLSRRPDGKRSYVRPRLVAEDMKRVERCVLHALGFFP